jgi:high affinity Mn2+ porin
MRHITRLTEKRDRRVIHLAGAIACLLFSLPALADAPPEESWNAFSQLTYIWNQKEAFSAAYTNLNGSPNSLSPDKERSYTGSATEFLGVKAWSGGEFYFVPEAISELAPSGLHGLGGSFPDGELEKNGSRSPTFYRSRLFLRQTWNLGGGSATVDSGPMQLAGSVDSRRFVLTAGNLSITDIFDKNLYVGDVRQQFLSMDFLTYAAYDFAADARGYSWGIAGEYYQGDWAIRGGRFLSPLHPNQLKLDYSIMNHFGDQVEVEHKHELFGAPGKIRILAYRNVENMGRWDDAITAFETDPAKNAAACTDFNYGSTNTGAPDLCWVRKKNAKVGFGLSLEQSIAPDAGVFFRGMKADGKTEVYSYTATDSSVALGAIVKGTRWGRAGDAVGVAYAQNWLSAEHVTYLNMGGIDGFIGDGRISYKPEAAFETYYNINVSKFFWITLDFQHVANPAYNSDRGPVSFYGFRLHTEF